MTFTPEPEVEKQLDEPIWVPRLAVEAVHHDQLVEHGGLQGLRDKNALEAALARPKHKFTYEPRADLAALAAAYAFGLTKAHPFADGNKRTAYVSAEGFLLMNGYTVKRSDTEVVEAMLAVADGALSEEVLAAWFREALAPLPLDDADDADDADDSDDAADAADANESDD